MSVVVRRSMAALAGALVAIGVAGCLGRPGAAGDTAPPAAGGTVTSPIATSSAVPTPTSSTSQTTSPGVSPTVSTAPSPTSTKTPTATPTSTPTASPKPTPKPTPTRTAPPRDYLQVGDRGPAVLALQQRLSGLGYWLGAPDAQFGNLTQQAVWALQKAAGIGRDGEVGAQTRAALARGIRPRATLSGNGVEIDLARQLLLVVRGGRTQLVLNTSTGSGLQFQERGETHTAVTPRGTYQVSFVVDGPDKGPLGTLWRPRYFNGGIAVHGLDSVPPYPASHGCARVSNTAMDMIWAQGLMPMGSTVVVR